VADPAAAGQAYAPPVRAAWDGNGVGTRG